ncbi:MAG: hypothetical protein ACYS22_16975 [Planctomycetota bacterium]
MNLEEVNEIEQRAELAQRTGSKIRMNPLDIMALCRAIKEGYIVAAEFQRQRNEIFAHVQELETSLAPMFERLQALEQLIAERTG